MGFFVVEAFSRSVIEAVRHEADVLVSDAIESHFLWKELANEAIHVFVSSPLPGGVEMGEIEVGTQLFSDVLVLAELFAVVSRQGFHSGWSGAMIFGGQIGPAPTVNLKEIPQILSLSASRMRHYASLAYQGRSVVFSQDHFRHAVCQTKAKRQKT